MIKQIKFVSIPVADQNRALDFYTEKLGFTIITDQPFDEKQRSTATSRLHRPCRDSQPLHSLPSKGEEAENQVTTSAQEKAPARQRFASASLNIVGRSPYFFFV